MKKLKKKKISQYVYGGQHDVFGNTNIGGTNVNSNVYVPNQGVTPANVYAMGTSDPLQKFHDIARDVNFQSQKFGNTAQFAVASLLKDPNAAKDFNNELNSAFGMANNVASTVGNIASLFGKGKSAGGAGAAGGAAKGKMGGAQIAEAAVQGLSMLANSAFGTSTATTSKEVAAQTANGIMQGAAAGAQFGPWGALAGAAIGSIGQKGRKAEMTSFTDYDEGTLGTGLIGAFSNRGLRRRLRAIKANAYNNKAAVQGTNYLQNEYLQEHGGMNTSTFAEGGQIPTSLVYVDDGEMIRTPQGDVLEVPERGKPTDSNLVNLPVGSEILSDSLKVPDTKKTFAQLEKWMISKRQSKGNDRFAENSKMLNERNNKSIHDQLFALQEYVKQQRGIKSKTKGLDIPMAKNGWKAGDLVYARTNKYNNPLLELKDDNTVDIAATHKEGSKYMNMRGLVLNELRNNFNDPKTQQAWNTWTNTLKTGNPNIKDKDITVDDFEKYTFDGKPGYAYKLDMFDYLNPSKGVEQTHTKPVHSPSDYGDIPMPEMSLDLVSDEVPDVDFDMEGLNKSVRKINRKANWQKVKDTLPAIGDTLSRLGELTPTIMNLLTETPEGVQANYNPYATAITNTMGNRRYNIEKERQEILRSRAIGNRNISQMNTNTGANLAYALNSAIQADKNIAEAYRYADNVNAQYAGEYANMMNNLGQQWTAETNRVQEANAANRAAARNIRRQGASQISQWLQRNRMEKNQSNHMAMLELYKPFLEASTPRENYERFINKAEKMRHRNLFG